MPDPFTIRIDEIYVDTIEQLEEEGYVESRTEGFVYALDRSLEAWNPDYEPITRPDPELDQRATEIFSELAEEQEHPFNLYEFKQDSRDLAVAAAEMAEELGDEEMMQDVEEYVSRYFPEADLEEF